MTTPLPCLRPSRMKCQHCPESTTGCAWPVHLYPPAPVPRLPLLCAPVIQGPAAESLQLSRPPHRQALCLKWPPSHLALTPAVLAPCADRWQPSLPIPRQMFPPALSTRPKSGRSFITDLSFCRGVSSGQDGILFFPSQGPGLVTNHDHTEISKT